MQNQDLELKVETHEYFWKGKKIPSVHDVLNAVNLIDYSFLSEIERQKAFDRGKAVHLACQYCDNNNLDNDSLHETLKPYVKAWMEFKTDWMVQNIEHGYPLLGMGYCGTHDLICDIGRNNKQKVLLDIKSGVAPWWIWLQLTAYAVILQVDNIGYVELHSDGGYRAVMSDLTYEMEEDWSAILRVYNVKSKMKG